MFITAGSDGTGLALATLFLEKDAKVTIASRSSSKLAAAKEALIRVSDSEKVFACSADVGNWKEVDCNLIPKNCIETELRSWQNIPVHNTHPLPLAAEQVQRAVAEAEAALGPIDVIIANAGTPSSGATFYILKSASTC